MFKKMISILLILAFFAVLFRTDGNTKAQAQQSDAYVRMVRTMPADSPEVQFPQGRSVDEANVDLSAVGAADLRGLAVDPSTGHLFVVSPGEQKLYELTQGGGVEAVRDLSKFGIKNPQRMVFAPSGDKTDDPTAMSLYVQTPGQIVELSLTEPTAPAAVDFSSALIKTTDMSLFKPPSPDPTGLAYLPVSNHLLVSDSDVEETVDGITHYQGVNIWELTLGGSVVYTTTVSSVPPSLVHMSDEPTGVAWNPSNGHYYFSDDKVDRIFDLDPGLDGKIGTADDAFTSFSVQGAGSTDPEGITYDSAHNSLFLSDGVNAEIYQFSLTGTLIGQFDVSQYGVVAPQSVDFNVASGTLFILEDGSNKVILETTVNGVLLRTISYSSIPTKDPGGLAFAPASDGSPANRFYIVDRGIDNNADPNIIDGKMFEITAPGLITPGNLPPTVDAGLNQTITLPDLSVDLNGTVTDDGLPNPPHAVTTQWSQVSGPCTVAFGNEHAVDTTAGFQYAGRYLLRLDATDSELNAWDTVTVDVNRPAHTKIFDALVEMGTDDAEETLTGAMIKHDTRVELGEKAGSAQKVGFRFNWLGIPHGATIINASIQFTANLASSGASSLTIRGQAADNAPTFSGSNFDISNRTTTSASVLWSPPDWIAQGDQLPAEKTPDLTNLVQEIVNRPGWANGNSMAFIITGTGTRMAYGYDGFACQAAVLHIEYDTAPVAVNDAYTTDENAALNVLAAGVLTNDTDVDLDTLHAVKVTDPSNGTVTLNADGSFTYTPDVHFNGTDSFTYKANDGTLDSANAATVTITVNPMGEFLFMPVISR